MNVDERFLWQSPADVMTVWRGLPITYEMVATLNAALSTSDLDTEERAAWLSLVALESSTPIRSVEDLPSRARRLLGL